jgi:hypothetical protein
MATRRKNTPKAVEAPAADAAAPENPKKKRGVKKPKTEQVAGQPLLVTRLGGPEDLKGEKQGDTDIPKAWPPAVKPREPEYRAYDGVTPKSSKDEAAKGSWIPPCIFGKAKKLAAVCRPKLFFAGEEAAAEMTTAGGKDYTPGAYLRMCGPKTNNSFLFVKADNVDTAMKRSASFCGCIETKDGKSCETDASALAGVRRRRAAAKRKTPRRVKP